MPKKYIVQLQTEEREQLLELTQNGQAAAKTITHARILLRTDCAEERVGWTDEAIAEALDTSIATVERVRKAYVQQGLKPALERRIRLRHRSRRLDGRQEAHLIALACSEPPEGHARWTLRLLAGRMIELEQLETLSPDTVHQTLKKTNSSRGSAKSGVSHRKPPGPLSPKWKRCSICINNRMIRATRKSVWTRPVNS